MAPRRRKAVTAVAEADTSIVETNAENDNPPSNGKPVKVDTKKSKAAKNVKDAVQNNQDDENTNGDAVSVPKVGKSKKASAAKNAKPTEQSVEAEQVEPVNGVSDDTKKRGGRGKPKQDDSQKVTESKATKTKSKKTDKKANVDDETVEPEQVLEPEPQPEPKPAKKATKGKSKKADVVVEEVVQQVVEPEPEPEPKPAKKATKGKSKKADDVVVEEEVPQTKSKRGAKKVESPEKPVEKPKGGKKQKAVEKEEPIVEEKPVKGKAKKTETEKPSEKAKTSKSKQKAEPVDELDEPPVEDDNEGESSKGRKRKPTKTAAAADKSPAKKTKKSNKVDEAKSAETKANGTPKKRKASAKTAIADSTTEDVGDFEDVEDELVTKRKKTTKTTAEKQPKVKKNATVTDYSTINFESEHKFNMKIVSWNVSGLRSLIDKKGFEYFEHEKPDVICLQEIKCLEDQVPEEAKLAGYHAYWCSTPGGRGGVAILSRAMPYSIEKNIGDEEMDEEGRIITAEYSKFYLISVYVPNAARELKNLDRRLRWNKLFDEHINKLKAKKPVIICGDMNVAHEEIDLANPKTNHKNAGFSPEERQGMTDLLAYGFVDTFREKHKEEKGAYTFWSYMNNARAKNVGWRLDYSIISENLKKHLVDSFMRPQVLGSDHCPIVLLMNL